MKGSDKRKLPSWTINELSLQKAQKLFETGDIGKMEVGTTKSNIIFAPRDRISTPPFLSQSTDKERASRADTHAVPVEAGD